MIFLKSFGIRCHKGSRFFSLKHLLHPIQPALWQRPRESLKDTDSIWYCSAPLGEKTLGSMMPKLSLKYGLSERYTNHSIRVTSLQVLEDLNIEGRHIIRISGHKSVNSVQNYDRPLSASRKRNISASFANHLSVSSDSGPSCSKLRKHNEPLVEKENCVTTARQIFFPYMVTSNING